MVHFESGPKESRWLQMACLLALASFVPSCSLTSKVTALMAKHPIKSYPKITAVQSIESLVPNSDLLPEVRVGLVLDGGGLQIDQWPLTQELVDSAKAMENRSSKASAPKIWACKISTDQFDWNSTDTHLKAVCLSQGDSANKAASSDSFAEDWQDAILLVYQVEDLVVNWQWRFAPAKGRQQNESVSFDFLNPQIPVHHSRVKPVRNWKNMGLQSGIGVLLVPAVIWDSLTSTLFIPAVIAVVLIVR